MAKSKALLEAEEKIKEYERQIVESAEVTGLLKDQQAELRRQLDASAKKARVRNEDYAGLCKRFDDLRAHSAEISKSFVGTALALASVVVDIHKKAAAGPFKCAGLTDCDPKNIFEHFAKKIPGGDHWQRGETKESGNDSGTMTW